jgi:hypothetical protein
MGTSRGRDDRRNNDLPRKPALGFVLGGAHELRGAICEAAQAPLTAAGSPAATTGAHQDRQAVRVPSGCCSGASSGGIAARMGEVGLSPAPHYRSALLPLLRRVMSSSVRSVRRWIRISRSRSLLALNASSTELVAEERERGVLVLTATPIVLAIDDPRLGDGAPLGLLADAVAALADAFARGPSG